MEIVSGYPIRKGEIGFRCNIRCKVKGRAISGPAFENEPNFMNNLRFIHYKSLYQRPLPDQAN
jgi:hypothetical protein